MAITLANLATLNQRISDAHETLRLVLDGLVAGEELVWDRAGTVVVTAEPVGTGTGSLGAVSGDFRLDWPVDSIADVSSLTVNAVARTPRVAGGQTGVGNEVEIVTGRGTNSGDLRFFVAGVATNVPNTELIVATYRPSRMDGSDAGPIRCELAASDLVGPGGLNSSYREQMRAILNPGRFRSPDAV